MSTRPSSRYTREEFLVSRGQVDLAGRPSHQKVMLDVCNNCGAVVGNRPAHDVFCDDGFNDGKGSSVPGGDHA